MASRSDNPLPGTRFARAGDVSIAYLEQGDGPIGLIVVPAIVSHVEYLHGLPGTPPFCVAWHRLPGL